jgi:tetratricopeptide (TPR) repeat protein
LIDGDRMRALYERAMFLGDESALVEAERELDAAEAELALARGRMLHVRFIESRVEDVVERELFERALELFAKTGDVRGEADAAFWLGIYHQVVRGDDEAARPLLERSHALAVECGDQLTRSYAARHLGFSELGAGRVDSGRELLEESLRLRREVGNQPATAAALQALGELDLEQGRAEEARARLEEAAELAKASGARRVLSGSKRRGAKGERC